MTQSGVVYSRHIDGQTVTFGISGRLYKSNVLLYDRQTDSLWSQLMARAISGPLVGKDLTALPSTRTTWTAWRKKHPQTLVLSDQTGYARDYTTDPYEGYYRVGALMFPVGKVRRDLDIKARVLGVAVNGRAKAWALETLVKRPGVLNDRVGDTDLVIEVSDDGQILSVNDSTGRPLAHVFVFWFAWQAFYPDTAVYGR